MYVDVRRCTVMYACPAPILVAVVVTIVLYRTVTLLSLFVPITRDPSKPTVRIEVQEERFEHIHICNWSLYFM